MASILATNGCALDAADEARDDDTSELAQDVSLSPNPCTLVKVTAPTTPFFGAVGVPITLSALATCPAGVTPEYQFWFKQVNAPNWQNRAAYVLGSSSWTPPSAGNWAVTVVARAVGAPEAYQARANAALGTITGAANLPPVAIEDTITTNLNTRASTNVLANDSDPDADVLTVTSFTQGAHGAVTFANGDASYTPATGYFGGDSFTYTIDDGHGATATATVFVTVAKSPACTISIVGPGTGMYGENLHFTAAAACVFGTAEVQWYRKLNSAYVVVQPFSTTTTLDIIADAAIHADLFYARVRMQGSTVIQATSGTVSVDVADNTPQCTQVKLTLPTSNQTVPANAPQTLTASATCPVGSVPEYQFWVKPALAPNWQILPGYSTISGSWSPPSVGAWAVKAAVRTVGSHVNYQVASAAVVVNVIDAGSCGNGIVTAGEECDDGNTADDDGCGHSCRIERCGDGLIQLALGESCDDSNAIDGDGCDAACHVEPFETTPPVPVSISGGQSCTTTVANAARKIAVDGSGTIYAVMTCGTQAAVTVSTNRGTSFSPLATLSEAETIVSQVAVATGPTGVAYVAMMLSDGQVVLRTTQNFGVAWGAPALLGTSTQSSAGLSLQSFNDDVYIGFFGTGGITVARNHTRGTGAFATTDVAMSVTFFDLLFDVGLGTLAVCADTPTFHVRASTDDGVTFAAEVNPPGQEFFSDWAIGNGRIFVSGTRLFGAEEVLMYVIPTNALSTSTSVGGLPSMGTSQARSLAADTDGNAFVASQLDNGAIQLDRLAFGGTAFDAPRTLAVAGQSPVVAALPGGSGAAVVYTINNGGTNEVWVTVQSY